MSDERDGERRELEATGWEPEDIDDDETIWRNPEDGNWYEERRAVQILKGGEDIGASE